MMFRVSSAPWRCVSASPWLAPLDSSARRRPRAGAGAELGPFVRQTWQLPPSVPRVSVRHAFSPLLPAPSAAVTRLVRALHGRLTVVNQAPVAALDRATRALVAGLVATARDRGPLAPWTAAPRRGSAAWPVDSRAAHARVLAIEWLARHGALAAWGRGRLVSVRLYEGPGRVTASDGGDLGAEQPEDVRNRVAARLPGRALRLPRLVATPAYRLVVVTAAPDQRWAEAPDRVDAAVATALADGAVGTGDGRGAVWFSGTVLLPDATVVEGMDDRARRRWAGYTGRAGAGDAYWHPESWERFLEPGRAACCVSPASVGMATRRPARVGVGAPLGPTVDRGVPVPPGYALVDCVGTLAVNAVAL